MARRSILDDHDGDHPIVLTVYDKCTDCSSSVSNCSRECFELYPIPPVSSSGKYHMPNYFIIMLCILGAAFVFLCYVTILKRYRLSRWLSREAAPPEGESREDFVDGDQAAAVDHPIWYIRTVGLPESVIESISIFKYKTGEGLTEVTDCSVCLTEFQEDESLRLLPKCSHAFHVPCIDTWLRSHKNCPMCRAPVISEAIQANAGEQSNDDVAVTEEQTGAENAADDAEDQRESGELGREIGPTIEGRNIKGIRAQSDLAEHRVIVAENFQPPRRFASMDLSTAEIELGKRNFEIGSSKPSSSSASRSSSWYRAMKRSFSTSSGKFSLPITSGRSQDF